MNIPDKSANKLQNIVLSVEKQENN